MTDNNTSIDASAEVSSETPQTESPRPTLTTARLRLRPFELGDAAAVHIIVDEREIASTTRSIEHPYPEGAAAKWLSQHQQLWDDGKAVIFAICEKPDDRVVGAIGLELNHQDHQGELGYWIAKADWGQGIATEAANAVVDFGFQQMGLHRIFAHHMTRNPASGRILEKIGMRKEGLLRGHFRKWGVFEDVVVYGILKTDPS